MNSCEENNNKLIFEKGLCNCENFENNFVPKSFIQESEENIHNIIPIITI